VTPSPILDATASRVRPPAAGTVPGAEGVARSRIVIGIGEFAVSDDVGAVLVTHALGSCIAVCLWDPAARVAGMLHFLLPDSRVNPARAQQQPATFADLGVPMLFQAAYKLGAMKSRCLVRLVGGADISGSGAGTLDVGMRNQLAAKNLLWRNGVLIKAERVGGSDPRNVLLGVGDGTLRITCGNQIVAEI
jgi:chemotaxis protein CheD